MITIVSQSRSSAKRSCEGWDGIKGRQLEERTKCTSAFLCFEIGFIGVQQCMLCRLMDPVEFVSRPKGLGLGAQRDTSLMPTKKHKKHIKPGESREEKVPHSIPD